MKFTVEDIAGLIDISAVQAEHGKEELDRLIETAKQYHFIAVHSLPSWVPYLKEHTAGSGILVGGPVGFPSGGGTACPRRCGRDGHDDKCGKAEIG